MNFYKKLIPLLIVMPLLTACNGCNKSNSATNSGATVAQPEIDPTHGHRLHAQPKLPTIKVWPLV
jgi:hypothetical protein